MRKKPTLIEPLEDTLGSKPITSATQLLKLMENTLGVAPDINDPTPLWKWRTMQAGRINKKRLGSTKYTWVNLELAVAYLWKNRIALKSPVGIFHFVDDAIKVAAEPEVSRPLEDLIDEAIRQERLDQSDGWRDWISTLNRAFGPYRAEVYAEWKKARG